MELVSTCVLLLQLLLCSTAQDTVSNDNATAAATLPTTTAGTLTTTVSEGEMFVSFCSQEYFVWRYFRGGISLDCFIVSCMSSRLFTLHRCHIVFIWT